MERQTSPLRGIPRIIFIYVFLAVVLWGGPYKVEGKRLSSSLHFIVANRNLSHPKRNMNSKEGVRSVRHEEKENHSGPMFNDSNLREELQHVKVSRNISEALHMATYEEMKRDKNVYVIGEDVGLYGGSYKVTKNLAHFFGFARVLDTPICENSFMGLGIGSAINGLRPIVEGMNLSFLIMAFNQISNNAGMLRYMTDGQFNIPLVIRGPGGVGKQLGPEHSQRIESYLMSVPGIKIVACSTPFNARGLLKSAIRDNNPVLFLEHVLLYNVTEEIPLLPYTLPIDKAEIVQKGTDLTILCYGINRHVALEASKELKKNNIDVEIVDLISLKPFDLETIKYSLQKTNKCLILDESAAYGGIGAELYTQIIENFSSYLKRKPVRLCTKDIPIPYSSAMEDACVVKKEDVVYMATYMHAN